MTTLAPFVVHTAAPPVGVVQLCASCGLVLMDNTSWVEGRVAVLEGDTRGLVWWPTGAQVATDKTGDRAPSMTYVVNPPGRPLAADERMCGGS